MGNILCPNLVVIWAIVALIAELIKLCLFPFFQITSRLISRRAMNTDEPFLNLSLTNDPT